MLYKEYFVVKARLEEVSILEIVRSCSSVPFRKSSIQMLIMRKCLWTRKDTEIIPFLAEELT